MSLRRLVLAVAAGSLSTLATADVDAFQIYAPWTNLGDAETWYDVGPDWTKTPSAPLLTAELSSTLTLTGKAAPAPAKTDSAEAYALATVRSRKTPAGTERFVSLESRSTEDAATMGCASGFADLGLPSFPKTRHPGLAPGQPYWVSTPAVTDEWIFVTVVENPRPYSSFMMPGRLYARRQTHGAVDLCSGWTTPWFELSIGPRPRLEDERGRRYDPAPSMPGLVGSAPSALTLPPGAPGAGNTYVCVDPMHDFGQNVSAACFVRRRGQESFVPFSVPIDPSFGYPVGRPALAYDRCQRRVVLAATDTQSRVAVLFASTEVASDGSLAVRQSTFKLVPSGRGTAGGVTLFQTRESCDLQMAVRVAAQAQFFIQPSPETQRMGCRATGPGPSVGCVSGAEFLTATLPAGEPLSGAWRFSQSPLPLAHADHGIGAAFARRRGPGAVVVFDRNERGRNYSQFLVRAGEWGTPTTYELR